MRRALWIGGSFVVSAVLTFAAIVGYWLSADRTSDSDSSPLEFAAVLTWATFIALCVGASVALLAFAITWWRSGLQEPDAGAP